MTIVLHGDATETVFSKPGLYLVFGDGTWSRPTEEPSAAAGMLAIHVTGDFVSSSPLGRAPLGRAPRGREILLNNRAPLGGLQRLQEGDVIELRQDSDFDGDLDGHSSSRLRLVYGRKAPPIRFVLPPSSPIRCGYTLSPLAGEAAVRCGQCFQLYGTRAWAGDLRGSCPRCGWPHEETSL